MLGVNFLGHGAFRILSGVRAFAEATAEHMGKSPLPHAFTYDFALGIPLIETALGLLLIAGLATRAVLTAGLVFLMALTVGVTSNQQWDVAGQQLVYALVFFVLLFLDEHNLYSADRWLRARSVQ